jgi:hypothetical protein
MTTVVSGEGRSDTRAVWLQALAWAAALAIAWAVLAGVDFRTKDPDSALHVGIVMDLAGKPARDWLAPEWGGRWDREGRYREHPPGLFILSMPLVAIGYPAAQAPLAVNALFQILSLLFLQQIARVFVPRADARAVGWLLQLLPIAFVFRVRANHEQLVLCFYLVALVAVEKSRTRPAWIAVAALAAVATLSVKGFFVALLLVSCAFWLIARPAPTPRARLIAWGGIAAMIVVTLSAAAWFEASYVALTHESFVGPYLAQQMGLAAMQRGDALAAVIGQKVSNLAWYGGRILWFAFPWGLVGLALLIPSVRRAWRWNAATTRETTLLVGLALLYVAVLSLSDRRADRYAFPSYYMVGLAGSVAALRSAPALRRVSAAMARLYPFDQVVVWLVTFALALPDLWNTFPKFKLINNY